MSPEAWGFLGVCATALSGVGVAALAKIQRGNADKDEARASDNALLASSVPELQWQTLGAAMRQIESQREYVIQLDARLRAIENDNERFLKFGRRAVAFIERMIQSGKLEEPEKQQAHDIIETWVDE